MKRYSVIIIRELRLKIILDLFLFLNKNTCKRMNIVYNIFDKIKLYKI